MDDFNLNRFVEAQADVYDEVLQELLIGQKQSHWMWFVFPQLKGLGHSPTASFYGIASLAEAREYLSHPLLGARLLECTQLVLDIEGRSAYEIFSSPDDFKFRSCMTLFQACEGHSQFFGAALREYYDNQPDERTLQLLQAK